MPSRDTSGNTRDEILRKPVVDLLAVLGVLGVLGVLDVLKVRKGNPPGMCAVRLEYVSGP
jgi:hypothetical protein